MPHCDSSKICPSNMACMFVLRDFLLSVVFEYVTLCIQFYLDYFRDIVLWCIFVVRHVFNYS